MSQWIETKGSFSVIDAPIMEDPEMLLYQSDIVAKGSHTHSAEVIAGGRVWQIQFKELAGQAEVPDRGRSQLTFAVGALATLLLTIAIAYQVALPPSTGRSAASTGSVGARIAPSRTAAPSGNCRTRNVLKTPYAQLTKN